MLIKININTYDQLFFTCEYFLFTMKNTRYITNFNCFTMNNTTSSMKIIIFCCGLYFYLLAIICLYEADIMIYVMNIFIHDHDY